MHCSGWEHHWLLLRMPASSTSGLIAYAAAAATATAAAAAATFAMVGLQFSPH
jgi:hypothetical protein